MVMSHMRREIFRISLVNALQLSLCYQRHGKSTSRSLFQFEHIAFLYGLFGDVVCLWVIFVVCVLGIGIDGALVFAPFVEEIEFYDAVVPVLIAFSTDEPVVGAFGAVSSLNTWASLVAHMVKSLLAMQETRVRSLG